MIRRAFVLCGVVALAAFCLTAGLSTELSLGAAGLELRKNPVPTSADSIKAGRAIYAKNCAGCHGLQGKGDGASAPKGSTPANLVAGKFKHGGSDSDIFKSIEEGIGPKPMIMKPWGEKLSDEDIWNTINFLRDLAKRAK
jgi:mono/diheme cytochrome c family protein